MTVRAAVLGGGSWGTTFAKVLTDAGTATVLWSRRHEVATAITERHENPDYLPALHLPAALRATTDPRVALAGADLVVLAVPSQSLRANLQGWAAHLPPDATLVSLMKGIELGTSMRMSEVIAEVAGVPPGRIAVLTGPNLAREIADEQPTATVVACTDPARAHQLQEACRTSYFRPYTNTDVVGCELGGAVKNVIALMVGIAAGMGLGDNTRASVITRGLAETARLGLALGADPLTFSGLAGLGDLVATCMSPLSRNRTFGEELGRGATVTQAENRMRQTAEGVKSCRSILALGVAHGVDLPITEQVVRIVEGEVSPREAARALMAREAKPERPGAPAGAE